MGNLTSAWINYIIWRHTYYGDALFHPENSDIKTMVGNMPNNLLEEIIIEDTKIPWEGEFIQFIKNEVAERRMLGHWL